MRIVHSPGHIFWGQTTGFNSLTPKSVLAGMQNSCWEGFLLAKHKLTKIPTMVVFCPCFDMMATAMTMASAGPIWHKHTPDGGI